MKNRLRIVSYNIVRFFPICIVVLALVLGFVLPVVLASNNSSSEARVSAFADSDNVALPAGTTYIVRQYIDVPVDPFPGPTTSQRYFWFSFASPAASSSVRPLGFFMYDYSAGGRTFDSFSACYGVYMSWSRASTSSLGGNYIRVNFIASNALAPSDVPGDLPGTGFDGQNELCYFVCMYDCVVSSSDYSFMQQYGVFSPSAAGGGDYQAGYDVGYSEGYNKGQTEQLNNPAAFLLSPAQAFMQIDLFGGFSLGDAFSVVMFVLIATIFIKMFAGG